MNRLFDLTGRRALVTGATRGLGHAIARGLAEAGAEVAVNARDPAMVASTVAQFAEAGLKALAAPFDVTDAPAMAKAVGALGEIDILVNNAGLQHRSPITEFPDEKWDEMLATHLTGPFRLVKLVAPGMIARRRGKIIQMGSLMCDLARPTITPYATAKGGLRMLTRGLAAELGPHNIQVNTIGPGYMATEMTKALQADPSFDGWVKKRAPAGRWGTPEDLVGVAVFLAAPASDYVNGQLIFVDGGMTAVV